MELTEDSYKEKNIDFIKQYRAQSGVSEIYNGVLFKEIVKGKGERPSPKSMVTVHYTGKLINGKTFDSTQKGKPASFKLSGLIQGWVIALKQMNVGSKWEIVIPYNMGYGARRAGAIKPYSTLIFEIQLLAIG